MVDLHLGVDGGNTKTVALLSTADGAVVGAGRSGCSDIYNARDEAAALHELDRAVGAAFADAGAEPGSVVSAVFCLAGADWPEDLVFLHDAIAARGHARRFSVANDALAGLRAGTQDGTGVILAAGTGGAIAARNASGGFWHSGFWSEPLGGGAIGRQAVQAVIRAELGLAPPTRLAASLVGHFGAADVEAMVKLTRGRDARASSDNEMGTLAPLVLSVAAAGDAAALAIVEGQAVLMVEYGRAAAARVGLPMKDTQVVLAGGVFRHASGLMPDMVRRLLASENVAIVAADREPATGALMLALEEAGLPMTPERLETLARSAPGPDFYRTED